MIEAWSLLIACALAVCWYAIPQLLYSLAFFYQLAQAAFPQIVPLVPLP